MSRKDQMLRAVDQLMRVHDDWQSDEKAPNVPTEAYEEALENCVAIVCNGDIPSECRELETTVSRLAMEWSDYRNAVKMNANGTPFDSLWSAYHGMVLARKGAIAPVQRTLESVAKLMSEKVPNLQIAKMYGARTRKSGLFDAVWEGVFFDESGRVQHDLLEQQAKFDKGEKGAKRVIPEDWIHPAEITRAQKESEDLDKRLKQLESQERQREDTSYEDPATIEELLSQGQFPATVAKIKRCSIEEVLEVSERIGVVPNDKDDEKTWAERHPEDIDNEVNQSIIDIAKYVNELHERNDVNPQKVAAIIREHKRKLETV